MIDYLTVKRVKVVFYGQQFQAGKSTTTIYGVGYELDVMLLKYSNGYPLVTVYINQLLTMAPLTVNPID